MILPPAMRSGATPATEPEMRPIEIRDGAGRLLRKLPLSKAEELVECGYGDWRRASNGRWFVSMCGATSDAIHHGAPASKTTLGRQDRKRHHPRCFSFTNSR